MPAAIAGGGPQRLVDADKIVPEGVQRDHVLVVLQLLAESVGEPGKPSHAHAHRQVRPLRVARADMLRVWVSGDRVLARSNAVWGAVAPRRFV